MASGPRVAMGTGMRHLVAALAALGIAACAPPDPSPTLETDTYLTRLPDGFATLDACTAAVPDPQECVAEMVLCATGDFHVQVGDVVDSGTYYLDHSTGTAIGERDGNEDFRLVLRTGVMTSGSGLAGQHPWTTPTTDFGVVSCY